MDVTRLANPGARSVRTYVPGKSIKEVQAELGLEHLIKLASNENPFGPAPAAARGFAGLAERIHIYPDSRSRVVRAALAERLGVSAEQITTGNGSDGVIYNLGMAVIDQDDEVIIPRITFPIYETITRVMRGKAVRSRMKDLRIDLEDIRRRVNRRTKLIFLCNPNNPTGDALPPEHLASFLSSIPERVLIALDEAYVDFTEPASRLDSIELFNRGMDNLFILRTFSKVYGLAGVRFGFAVGDRELVSLIERVKPPFDVSLAAEEAALHALADRDFYLRTLASCGEEKSYFYSELDALGLGYIPSHTNFVLIDTGRDAGAVVQALLRRGVIVRSAVQYSLPQHIRVTVGRHEENERFFRAFAEALEETA
jgi:histidinol-phosphate aminotransferase